MKHRTTFEEQTFRALNVQGILNMIRVNAKSVFTIQWQHKKYPKDSRSDARAMQWDREDIENGNAHDGAPQCSSQTL